MTRAKRDQGAGNGGRQETEGEPDDAVPGRRRRTASGGRLALDTASGRVARRVGQARRGRAPDLHPPSGRTYGYSLDQMDQERRTQYGHKSPRADIIIWETPTDKANNKNIVLVVECKAEAIDINLKDYYQGESYTRAVGCEFFVRPQHALHRRLQARARPRPATSCRSTSCRRRRTGATPSASRRSRTGSAPSTAGSSRISCSSATPSCATCTRWTPAELRHHPRKSCS